MTDGRDLGAALALRHASARTVEIDRSVSLLNHSELPRTDDWSLRSSLTRLAQPFPVRAAEVLELVRRCDYAMSQLQREFEAHPAVCDRRLAVSDGLALVAEAPCPDGRASDVARLIRVRPDAADAILTGYESEAGPLSPGERAAIPVLVGILAIDELAEELAAWAARGSRNPPLSAVDSTVQRLTSYLEQIGVPLDTGPPWPGRGRERST